MRKELERYGEKGLDDPVSLEEEECLNFVESIEWTEEEIQELNRPTTEEEVEEILKHETNLDSAPGEDGLTSRCLLTFWKFSSFRWLYVRFLNFTRSAENYENRNNIGVMH